MKLAFDIDDTICDFVTAFFAYHNDVYGTQLTRSDLKSYELTATLSCLPHEVTDRLTDFYNSDYFAQAQPLEGAVATLKQLAQRHDIIFMTARPQWLEPLTHAWLRKHAAALPYSLYFAKNPYKEWGTQNKGELTKQLGAHFLIDDSIEHARECAAVGVTTLLIDTPWNQGDTPPTAIRVRNAQHAGEVIEQHALQNAVPPNATIAADD